MITAFSHSLDPMTKSIPTYHLWSLKNVCPCLLIGCYMRRWRGQGSGCRV